MQGLSRSLALAMSATLALMASATLAQPVDMTVEIPAQTPPPAVREDGAVAVAPFDLPVSAYMSPEAREAFVKGARMMAQAAARQGASSATAPRRDVGQLRKQMDARAAPKLARVREKFPYTSVKTRMGGVPVEVLTPAAGIAPENRNRVLINLHGGGFMLGGGGTGGVLESAPVAHFGRIKVVAVDYRMAPEFRFPAASEDVAAVYRELLKTYRPERIGIYGCSSGGQLAAQAVAWFRKAGLPRPGAIGVLCSSTQAGALGDSAYIVPRLTGGNVPTPETGGLTGPYFAGARMDDPLVTPSASRELLRAFPPTLFLTGTRAPEMSAATRSHRELLQAGVRSELVLFDGMGHGFHGNPDLPESEEANRIVARFFRANLAR